MVNRIYPSELQLLINKANVSDAEALFLDLHLSISDVFVKANLRVTRAIGDWYSFVLS